MHSGILGFRSAAALGEGAVVFRFQYTDHALNICTCALSRRAPEDSLVNVSDPGQDGAEFLIPTDGTVFVEST